MGLVGAVMRFFYDTNDENDRKIYNGTIWIFLVCTTFSVTLLLHFTGQSIFEGIFNDIAFHPYIKIAIWTVFLLILSEIPLSLFIVRKKAIPYITLQISSFLLNMAFVIYFVVFRNEGALGSLKGLFISSLILSIVFVYITLNEIKISFLKEKLFASLAFGLPLVAHTLSHWALDLSDRFILAQFVSLEAIGIYSLGYQFGTIIRFFSTSINKAFVPFYYENASKNNGKIILSKFSTYYAGTITILAVVIALLSKEVIFIMADPDYHSAYQFVPLVTCGYLMLALYLIPVNGLFYTKRTKLIPVVTIISVAFNLGFNIVMIPKIGIMAAAYATFLSYFLLFIGISIISYYTFPIPYEINRLLKIFFSACITFYLCNKLNLDNLYLQLSLKTIFSIIGIPLVLYLLMFYSNEEKNMIKKIVFFGG